MLPIIRERATPKQISQVPEVHDGLMIKLAVDVQKGILVGGGELQADCEQLLLESGSQPEAIWGADWYPELRRVGMESLINIRPRQQNRGLEIKDPLLREKIESIVRRLLEID